MEAIVLRIAEELSLQTDQVARTAELLDSGATVPFIARYRKELTGSLDEEQIRNIRDRMHQLRELEKRRLAILESIREQDKLTSELEQQIREAPTMAQLEDLYLPYRPKRRTRATIAVEKGLEGLAKILMKQQETDAEGRAAQFINPEKGVGTIEDALAGARDIIAEWVNEHAGARNQVRKLFRREAVIRSVAVKGKELDGSKYRSWFSWEEPLMKAPSHRILAMNRGEKEGYLRVRAYPPEEKAIEILERIFLRSENASAEQVRMAAQDGYRRLMLPSIENEVRKEVTERADAEAIRIFSENLRQLLMAPPLGQKVVMAIDPGFRTGCKLVILDRQGKLLHNETIYPHPPNNEVPQSVRKIQQLVNSYRVEAIAVGNGTAGRETEDLIRRIRFDRDVIAVMVNESGASVYSASDTAREEMPDYDVTVRGAVSIGRRLMDPLAELVKIEPRSIGVGQYQHDVDQTALAATLGDTVVSCVNAVGVEVNTASPHLLAYVSGVGPALARNVVSYRNQNGPFRSRQDFMRVPRFGPRAFEQAAGFLRIREGDDPLDKSAVHPESYGVVEKMAATLNTRLEELIGNEALVRRIKPEDFVTPTAGLPTIRDILDELIKPGRDPREKFGMFEFDPSVRDIGDLRSGMILPGIVTNITAFGAFVDVGVHQDGLVHISQMAKAFVRDPADVVRLNQKVMVKVVDVDMERNRIQLSMKDVDQKRNPAKI
ncbi:MAG: RNA-binding transcriptional accessory protein [Bacteroidales bacterium]|nr:RNA-binding transcriptional accessory protein [Bacteroidales bacterium]